MAQKLKLYQPQMDTAWQSRNQKGGQLSSLEEEDEEEDEEEEEEEDEDESLRRRRKLSWIAAQMDKDLSERGKGFGVLIFDFRLGEKGRSW